MSGKGSRQRRVEAVNAARDDVYASNGKGDLLTVFINIRQQHIYDKAYAHWMQHYRIMEDLCNDLVEIYGGETE